MTSHDSDYGSHHSHYQLNYCKPFSIGYKADIHVIVKIESADSIPNLHSILSASDGVSFKMFRSCILDIYTFNTFS